MNWPGILLLGCIFGGFALICMIDEYMIRNVKHEQIDRW
jgi:hypothetical protein